MATTWMCDNGHHGTTERRSLADGPGWSGMYTGHCAGTVLDLSNDSQNEPSEHACSCSCHS